VSRTEEKGPSDEHASTDDGADEARDACTGDHDRQPVIQSLGSSGTYPVGGPGLTDETDRTRLIADLTRLIHQPAVPEATRLAGLTLIGWLARRRPEEMPHTIGIDEARESERRIRAARKAR
jgi:hypothetical protein